MKINGIIMAIMGFMVAAILFLTISLYVEKNKNSHPQSETQPQTETQYQELDTTTSKGLNTLAEGTIEKNTSGIDNSSNTTDIEEITTPALLDESKIGTYATIEEIQAYISSCEYGHIQAIKRGDTYFITSLYNNNIGNWRIVSDGEYITYAVPYDFNIDNGDILVEFSSGENSTFMITGEITYGFHAMPLIFKRNSNGSQVYLSFSYGLYDNIRHCCINDDLPGDIDDAMILTINGIDVSDELINNKLYSFDEDSISGVKYVYPSGSDSEIVTLGVILNSKYAEYSFVTNGYFTSASKKTSVERNGYFTKEGYIVLLDPSVNMEWATPGDYCNISGNTLLHIVSNHLAEEYPEVTEEPATSAVTAPSEIPFNFRDKDGNITILHCESVNMCTDETGEYLELYFTSTSTADLAELTQQVYGYNTVDRYLDAYVGDEYIKRCIIQTPISEGHIYIYFDSSSAVNYFGTKIIEAEFC